MQQRLDWERRKAIIAEWRANRWDRWKQQGGTYQDLADRIGGITRDRARQLVVRYERECGGTPCR